MARIDIISMWRFAKTCFWLVYLDQGHSAKSVDSIIDYEERWCVKHQSIFTSKEMELKEQCCATLSLISEFPANAIPASLRLFLTLFYYCKTTNIICHLTVSLVMVFLLGLILSALS